MWLPLFFLLLSLPAVTPRIYASDEIEYFAYLRSLWFDHDLSFENEYQHFYEHNVGRDQGFHETFLERTTETGRRINFAPIGCAILWAPFYALGDLTARLMHWAGGEVPVDGYSPPYVAAVSYGSAFYGWAAVMLSLLVVRRVTDVTAAIATAAALCIWLGTPLLFYTHVAPPMSHAASAFLVAAFVLTWLVVRERWSLGGCAALGALAALMSMVREQDLFFAVGPGLDLILAARKTGLHPRPLIARLLCAATAFAIVYVPQALAYITLNGRIGPSGIVERKMTWTAPHAVEVLVSPEHGFLVWTPLAAIAITGLVLLAGRGSANMRDSRRVAVLALLMIAVQIYVAGSIESWTVAGAFGQRRFVALTVLLTVGLAVILQTARSLPARALAGGLVALAVWWNIGLMVQFGAGLMDRQKLEPARNAYNTFVVVPRRLPTIAVRYLFDRRSFYRTPADGTR